jgi:class 3 adenylate cyclase
LQFKGGVNCGKLSAGILGRSRKFYRLFGDTVVTSARMCQSSVPGTVQISESLHHLMGDLEPARGDIREVKMKGKGMVNCYVVNDKSGTSYDLESYKYKPEAHAPWPTTVPDP